MRVRLRHVGGIATRSCRRRARVRVARRGLAVPVAPGSCSAPPCAARARTFDEFQVYDGRIAEPGNFDYDQHFVFGRRGRTTDEGAPRNGLLVMPEVGYATTTWHEVAVYLPVAREFSGDVFGGGFKLRNTFVMPKAEERPIAGGIDIEIRHQSTRFSEANWAMTLRPIIDFRTGPWQLILNPSLEIPFGRDSAVFAPAVRGGAAGLGERLARRGALHGFRPRGPLGNGAPAGPAALRRHRHPRQRALRAVNAGLGHGLTRNSDRWVGKLILRVDF